MSMKVTRCEFVYGMTCKEVCEFMSNIVRCRDCEHYNNQEPGGEIGTCNLGLEDLDLYSIVEPDGFCAWGVKDGDAR